MDTRLIRVRITDALLYAELLKPFVFYITITIIKNMFSDFWLNLFLRCIRKKHFWYRKHHKSLLCPNFSSVSAFYFYVFCFYSTFLFCSHSAASEIKCWDKHRKKILKYQKIDLNKINNKINWMKWSYLIVNNVNECVQPQVLRTLRSSLFSILSF